MGILLGVLTRTDGTRQVMYNGMPLYYYNADPNVGDTNGQLRWQRLVYRASQHHYDQQRPGNRRTRIAQ